MPNISSCIANRVSQIVDCKPIFDQRPSTLERGFTLIEILVVIAIISTVALIGIPNLRRLNQNQEYQSKASELVNSLKRMQSNSQAGIVCSPTTPSQSWNLRINNSSQYELYPICGMAGAAGTVGGSTSTIDLPPEVEITSIETNSGVCDNFDRNLNKVVISFTNNNRGINFNGHPSCTLPTTNKLNIYLTYRTTVLGITVTKGGAIYQCQLNGSNKCI